MPMYASREDKVVHGIIGMWIYTASHQVDDIGLWRQRPVYRALHEGWPHAPEGFLTDTDHLCGFIRKNHPSIDPAPLERIYRAVKLWHSDQSAKKIVRQSELEATLDLAIMRLHSVEMAITSRALPEPEAAEHRAPAATGGAGGNAPATTRPDAGGSPAIAAVAGPGGGSKPATTWQAVRDELLAKMQRGDDYTSATSLANELHKKRSTVYKAIQKTPELRTWKAGKGKRTLRTQSLNERVTDRQPGKADDPAVTVAARDELARLIQEQKRDSRIDEGRKRIHSRKA